MGYPLFDSLKTASYKGVAFDFQDVSDQVGNAIARHEYPNRPGADLEDMGRQARVIELKAVFLGADGLARRDALLKKIEEGGTDALIHPVWGTIQCQCEMANVRHSHSGRDYCEIDLRFTEDSTNWHAFVVEDAQSTQTQAQQALARARAAAQGFKS
jgi:prophage DNA circulation protein